MVKKYAKKAKKFKEGADVNGKVKRRTMTEDEERKEKENLTFFKRMDKRMRLWLAQSYLCLEVKLYNVLLIMSHIFMSGH